MEPDLAHIARESDAAVEAARTRLVEAVRDATRAGMTQQQIAEQIGRSQPEVNRLLRFHGSTPHARALRQHRAEIRSRLRAVGGRNVRVFGSTARGAERPDSDVDLLFEMREPLSLMQLSAVENELSRLLGLQVDLVAESSLRPDLREGIVNEAVPL
ncbi:nucleotidyltransferase domain-containing protein [Demequina capsici]|uniref:Nucleotidyltransferase domain-containing protein n=1 Tax=Demequina capsici TaxID=3075620 RepID=A0AA96F8B1_9MICO|nr:nucleotidyltransferase domain-containing protein [Demequina sp. OYTSA14]WNM23540.1 nucleotidyltransferase domain-containing protein [Demequina sp. OYTSA14]